MHSTSETTTIEYIEISPKRSILRKHAYEHIKKWDEEIKKCTNNMRGEVNISGIAQILLRNIDLSKADCKILNLIVIEKKEHKKVLLSYRLVNKLFLT